MALPSSIVGIPGEPMTQSLDGRWTMAYAAALGHTEPAFFDTRARSDVLAHPIFPVCFEWPLMIGAAHHPAFEALPPAERVRGVHASHHTLLHRPIRAGERVTTCARAVLVEARRPGAYLLTRLESADEQGRPLCTTWYGTLYRGIAVEGGDRSEPEALPQPVAPLPVDPGVVSIDLSVPAGAAHVYTECARIWNPIHTDVAVAHAAGLPDIILHGTATLALAVSRVVETRLDGDFERVGTVEGRFAAMVRMPSHCEVRVSEGPPYAFEVRNAQGERAIRDGVVTLR